MTEKQNDPEGGIPSGSMEVVWEVNGLVSQQPEILGEQDPEKSVSMLRAYYRQFFRRCQHRFYPGHYTTY